MPRLLVLPLLLGAALSVAAPAAAQPGDSCTPVMVANNWVWACAGVRCNDICGPEPYLYVTCDLDTIQARCTNIGLD